jgi:hypothetical protein
VRSLGQDPECVSVLLHEGAAGLHLRGDLGIVGRQEEPTGRAGREVN